MTSGVNMTLVVNTKTKSEIQDDGHCLDSTSSLEK